MNSLVLSILIWALPPLTLAAFVFGATRKLSVRRRVALRAAGIIAILVVFVLIAVILVLVLNT
jgi:hypothetical protein